jgi:hypothetical protein
MSAVEQALTPLAKARANAGFVVLNIRHQEIP